MTFEELAKYHSLSLMKWDEDFYASENTQLVKAFYEAGQQSKHNELKALLARYKQHTKLHTNDEFNRGWVSAFCCVVEDLEKLIK